MKLCRLVAVLAWLTVCGHAASAPEQFVLLNFAPGATFNQQVPGSFSLEVLERVRRTVGDFSSPRARLGFSFIFSYFNSRDTNVLRESLRACLRLAEETGAPVLIQLDGEYWLGQRPDLWNWWDPARPMYDPEHARDVEWTGWSPQHALKIGWLNWGRQIRVLPPPNLMSPRYRQACHEQMRWIIPEILQWWNRLPSNQKHLLVGIKVGWESSVGVNVFHYPNGNDLLARPESEDPRTGINPLKLPDRGVAQIGYAAVSTAGLRTNGTLTEADLAEIARRHLEDLSRVAASLGVPRTHLFTHAAGWKERELNYAAALNRYSSPGWSFYRHASDPSRDPAVRELLEKSDAPFWAATEWLLQSEDALAWEKALTQTLAHPRCRYVCIFNWESVRDNPAAQKGLRQFLQSEP